MVDKLFIKRLVVDEFEYEKPDIGYDYGFNLSGGQAKCRKCTEAYYESSQMTEKLENTAEV